jgi:lysozyme
MTDIPPPLPPGTALPRGKGYVPIAVAILMVLEGTVLVGYHDRIDPPGVNTVCTGHIEDVQIGDTYTRIECKDMLAKDLPRYEKMVEKCIHVAMPDYRHAAILSFTYNVGGGALCKSSVARKLNAGDVVGGCNALLLYDRANGKIIKGLETRRKAERKMCLSDANNPNATIEAGPAVPPEQHVDIVKPDKPKQIIGVVPDKEKVIVAPAPAPQPNAWQRVKAWFMEK